ncbi:MAG TPA: hypothetical protein VG275_07125 [Solirubrobacteraceae bacterium]|jgi:hypothetical protein|nr:hypothetical protein [Solirubrobacteraceae bacterium]
MDLVKEPARVTRTMRGLAILVLEDPEGELARAAGLALARVVLEAVVRDGVAEGD